MVVLDGVPVPRNTLSYLNPNDIESVTVLRGANASTLYGSEGINGALLVTTKKGANRKPTVTFSHSSNVDQVSFLPKFQNGWGNGSGYGGLTAAGNYRSYENQSYGDAYDGSIRPLGRTAEDGSVYYVPYTARPKEKYKVWDIGYTMQNDVSLSGGDATSSFYISLQDVLTKGVVPGDDIRRDNARFSASKQYGKFKASFTANYAQDRYEVHDDELNGNNFYELVMNTPGYVPLTQLRDWKNDKFASPNGYFNDYYNSPWFELDNNRSKGGRNYFNGSLDLNLKINDNIEFINRVGIASTQSFSKTTQGKFSYTNWARNLAFYGSFP